LTDRTEHFFQLVLDAMTYFLNLIGHIFQHEELAPLDLAMLNEVPVDVGQDAAPDFKSGTVEYVRLECQS